MIVITTLSHSGTDRCVRYRTRGKLTAQIAAAGDDDGDDDMTMTIMPVTLTGQDDDDDIDVASVLKTQHVN
eukprot:4014368-Pyramimonas_sp.AAC.1